MLAVLNYLKVRYLGEKGQGMTVASRAVHFGQSLSPAVL